MIVWVMKLISYILRRVFGPGKLTYIDQIALNAWRDGLRDETKDILDSQIAGVSLIQHQAGGGKVCFYYPSKHRLPLFTHKGEDVRVATVQLGVSGAVLFRANIYVFRRLFFSIEYTKRPVSVVRRHRLVDKQIEVIAVKHLETLI